MHATSEMGIERIAEKVRAGERLNRADGRALLAATEPDDLERIRQLADQKRAQEVGDVVSFASTFHVNPTNLCELSCQLCSFYAKPGWESAWFLTPEQVEEKIRANLDQKLTEIHVVGGLWRDCDLDYYQELFTRIKAIDPKLHIKALTPVEYDFLAKHHDISIEEVFRRMMSWGLDSLPGGGAEILVEEIRAKIAAGKISCDEFLEIHKLVHKLGLRSNITMLFNHVESYDDILTHLLKVREVQDETGGFKTFVPLKFAVENNALGKRKKRLQEKNIPLVYAVSRLMLDNIPNQKVLWNYVGVQEGLELLNWGANDFSSTNANEKIIVMAGREPVPMTEQTMSELIRKVGRTPKLTNSESV